jgi:hypothetical protein
MQVGGAMKLYAALVAVALAAILAGCASQEPAPDGAALPHPTDEVPLDSIALIDQAFAAGDIDYTTGLLYKVYAMFDPLSLPPEFTSDVPAKCGTPLILEVQRNWHRFTPEEQAEIGMYIQPIRDPGDPVDTDLDDVTGDHLDQDRERDRID